MLDRFFASIFAIAVVVTTPVASGPIASVVTAPGAERIVFTARTKGSDDARQAIYVADGDGSNVRRLPMDDSLTYDWAAWAMNGTKIVYTALDPQQRPPRADILIMDPDGSDRIRLTDNPLVNAQPKISPDGRSLFFSAGWEEFPRAAIYRMDLATFEVVNITARSGGRGGFDTDPKFSADGSTIAFVFAIDVSVAKGPFATEISLMDATGLGRRRVTDDGYFNTDPSISPDGREIAYSSYRGTTDPLPPGKPPVLSPWHLVVVDATTREQRVLTKGNLCTSAIETCSPTDGAAFVAQWSTDGQRIGYISIRSAFLSGIYVMDRDGRNAHSLIETSTLGINWWDWTTVGSAPQGVVGRIGSERSEVRLLYAARQSVNADPGTAPLRLFTSGPDRWTSSEIHVAGEPLELRTARWTPDRRGILLTARRPTGLAAPYPPPPAGETRHEHINVDTIGRLQSPEAQAARDPAAAEEQIYVVRADGTGLRQLTTPWVEDYMDAVPQGDARGNTDPDLSPDGRYLVFTNLSTISFESFILRLDLRTGEVINLTSVTAGALPVADAKPRISPDGSRIVFASAVGDVSTGEVTTQLFVMGIDGTHVRQLTDDAYFNTDPVWSPDGRSIAFGSYRGSISLDLDAGSDRTSPGTPRTDWILATLAIGSGAITTLTTIDQPSAFRPAWYPDGTKIGFISFGPSQQPDIYVVDLLGGRPSPLQTTLVSKEELLDWR